MLLTITLYIHKFFIVFAAFTVVRKVTTDGTDVINTS